MELVPLYASDVGDEPPDKLAVSELYFRHRGERVGFRYRFASNPLGKSTAFSPFP